MVLYGVLREGFKKYKEIFNKYKPDSSKRMLLESSRNVSAVICYR